MDPHEYRLRAEYNYIECNRATREASERQLYESNSASAGCIVGCCQIGAVGVLGCGKVLTDPICCNTPMLPGCVGVGCESAGIAGCIKGTAFWGCTPCGSITGIICGGAFLGYWGVKACQGCCKDNEAAPATEETPIISEQPGSSGPRTSINDAAATVGTGAYVGTATM